MTNLNTHLVEKGVNINLLQTFLESVKDSYVVIDTETEVLDFKKDEIRDHKLVLFQIGNNETQFLIPYSEKDLIITTLNYINDNGITAVGHNIKYDYHIIYYFSGIKLKKVVDTMVAQYILSMNKETPKGFYSLESTFERYFGYSPYVDEVSKSIRTTFRRSESLSEAALSYAALDIVVTDKVYQRASKELVEHDLTNVAKLEYSFLRVIAEMEITGMPIDVDRWVELDSLITSKAEEALDKLKSVHNIENWNSPKQVGELFISLGIPCRDNTGKVSVSRTTLSSVDKTEFPIVDDYLKYKALQKVKSSYGIKFLKHVSKHTGRVHTTFMQILNTGRTSSSSPNLQNIVSSSELLPEGDEWRKAFTAPKGRVLIVSDFANQELRILADKSGEKVMQKALNNNEDLHSITASKVYNMKVTKTENSHLRHAGKVLNFAIAYGAGPDKISNALNISKKEAAKVIANFYRGYPSLKNYFDVREQEVYKYGYLIVDNIGRKAFFDISNMDSKLAGEYRRKSQNYCIQATAASMAKLAGVIILADIEKSKLNANVVSLIHDEFIVECDESDSETVKTIVENAMSIAGKAFSPSTPSYGDAKVSRNWLK
jgi:DNA polymerase-1